jgi:hypothetical protein
VDGPQKAETKREPSIISPPMISSSGSAYRRAGKSLDETEPAPEPTLWECVSEYAAAAAALMPAGRIDAAIRPVARDWLRADLAGWHTGWKYNFVDTFSWRDEWAGWLDLQRDRDAALDKLTDAFLPAALATLPGDERWWLLVYAELRGTGHVEHPPRPRRWDKERCRWAESWPYDGDPLAVIRWPCEASEDLLMRLLTEALEGGWVGGCPPEPHSQRRPRRGRRNRKEDTDNDRKILSLWGSGRFDFYKDVADEVGDGVTPEQVKLVIDRHRHRAGQDRPGTH